MTDAPGQMATTYEAIAETIANLQRQCADATSQRMVMFLDFHLRRARREALEQAAKIVEGHQCIEWNCWCRGEMGQAIRKLAEEVK